MLIIFEEPALVSFMLFFCSQVLPDSLLSPSAHFGFYSSFSGYISSSPTSLQQGPGLQCFRDTPSTGTMQVGSAGASCCTVRPEPLQLCTVPPVVAMLHCCPICTGCCPVTSCCGRQGSLFSPCPPASHSLVPFPTHP